VPVGDDQSQHVELARDVANRFNTRYGRTFVVPRAVNPPVAARVMDLADPTGKMGKSSTVDSGLIYLLDRPDLVRRKIARAVTDGEGEVVYDPYRKPGVSNLLEILAACERDQPDTTALRFTSYSELKEALTAAIVDTLAPLQRTHAELIADRGYLDQVRQRARSGSVIGRSRPYGAPSTPSGSRPDQCSGVTARARRRCMTGSLGHAVTRYRTGV
jgi:tryptophanyl-tRNA synthetase